MTKEKDAPTRPPLAVELRMPDGYSESQAMASLQVDPMFRNAYITSTAASGVLRTGKTQADFSDTLAAVTNVTDAAKAGDLAHVSATLAAQVVSLDAIYADLVQRCYMNLPNHPDGAFKLMGLALKAQANGRATAEALTRIHQPREQIVRHVHVHEGGQAVVAEEFHHHAGGAGNAGYAYQPQGAGAGVPTASAALSGPQPLGEAVPIPQGERAPSLSPARRRERIGGTVRKSKCTQARDEKP